VIDKKAQIKTILERLYAKYNHHELIKPDPLQFVYRYSDTIDMEIAGLLSSCLAYGRVEQIEKSLIRLFGIMGKSPAGFILNFNTLKRSRLSSFKHRFTSGNDISDMLLLLKKILIEYGSIESFFLKECRQNQQNIIPALSVFCKLLLKIHAGIRGGNISKGLRYLLPSPSSGSPCKRLNLFLRWMVRKDDVDTGLWRSVDKAALIVPVDVHMARLCRIMGLYDRKTVSLKTAQEITESFREISPEDPVKYDFALSRIGILEKCTGLLQNRCPDCELYEFCNTM
jgi:uncharacterized protein (TIGR02757 family)